MSDAHMHSESVRKNTGGINPASMRVGILLILIRSVYVCLHSNASVKVFASSFVCLLCVL